MRLLLIIILITSCSKSFSLLPGVNNVAITNPCLLFSALLVLDPAKTGSAPYGLASGDYNADGIIDLIAGSATTPELTLFIPQKGNLVPPTRLLVDSESYEIINARINGQLYWFASLANGLANGSVIVFQKDQTKPALITILTGKVPQGMVVADFNADGKQDLIVANFKEDFLTVVNNVISGTNPTTTITVGTGPSRVKIIDLNGDAKSDLAVLNYTDKTVSLCTNTSTTAITFTCTAQPLPPSIIQPETIEVVPSGLAISDSKGTTVTFFQVASGSLNFSYQVTVGTAPTGLVAADFNGDGKLDLAVANNGSDTVSILSQTDPNTAFSVVDTCATSNPGILGGPRGITTGDFDDNGHLDIAVANLLNSTVSILFR